MVARGEARIGPGPLESVIDPVVFLSELEERGLRVEIDRTN
jgi:hypothetical protein